MGNTPSLTWRCSAQRSHGPCHCVNDADAESCGACGADQPSPPADAGAPLGGMSVRGERCLASILADETGLLTSEAHAEMAHEIVRLRGVCSALFAERASSPADTVLFAERIAADMLAGAVCRLVRSGALDARSEAGDAVLSYASVRHGDSNPIGNVERVYDDARARRAEGASCVRERAQP